MEKIVHIMLAGSVTDGWLYQDNLLTKYHRKMGFEVAMVASQWVFNDCGKLVLYKKTDYINDDNVKVFRLRIKGKNDFNKKWKRFNGLYEVLIQEKPDILFIHNVSFADVDVVCKYLKKYPVRKLYVDNHMDFLNSGSNWFSKNILHKIIWKHYAQMLNPFTTKFYGVLPARVDWLVNMYGLPKEKCELLVMGIDDDKFIETQNAGTREEIRKKYSIAPDDFLVMTGGKIDTWKKQTLLLMEAVKNIKNEKVKLVVFGSVSPELKEKVDTFSGGSRVQYIGWVQPEQSYSYWSAADLAVFPCRHSVFWEQVAGMGIPMLCKRWDGFTHVDVGGNVKFFNKDSVEEIQEILQNLFENPDEYNKMLEAARSKGREKFSYKDIAARSIQ